MRKIFIIGGIFILPVLVWGVYFFSTGNSLNDLLAKKNKTQDTLVTTQVKLIKDKSTLEAMTTVFKSSFALAIGVQDQVKKASDIIRQTDFMFIDPNSLNPELIIKNLPNRISINNQRKDINLILIEWQKETDMLSVKKIDLIESQKIRQDALIIKSFIQELAKAVVQLTPENSGLTQFQINNYSAQFPTIRSINEVLDSLGNSIENTNTPNTPTGNQSNIVIEYTVNPEDVLAQQAVVAEAEARVTALQQQLAQIEEQIQQSYPEYFPVSVETNTTPSPIPETETETPAPLTSPIPVDAAPDPYANKRVINRDDFQGIIVQPGPPRLIQGIDQF